MQACFILATVGTMAFKLIDSNKLVDTKFSGVSLLTF